MRFAAMMHADAMAKQTSLSVDHTDAYDQTGDKQPRQSCPEGDLVAAACTWHSAAQHVMRTDSCYSA